MNADTIKHVNLVTNAPNRNKSKEVFLCRNIEMYSCKKKNILPGHLGLFAYYQTSAILRQNVDQCTEKHVGNVGDLGSRWSHTPFYAQRNLFQVCSRSKDDNNKASETAKRKKAY